MAKKKKSNDFIIDIVPLTRIPLTRNQSFSYLYDTKLSPGTLVNVPLFRRKVEGIVLGAKDDFKRHGGIELKKVEKVIEENFLTDAQMKLAQFISDYYIAPLGIGMKGFVPKRTKARKTKIKNTVVEPSSALRASSPVNGRRGNISLTREQQLAVEKISNFKFQISNFLLFGPAGSGKTEVYIHSMLKIREKSKTAQFLVLVPEKTLTPQAVERYGQYFAPEEIAVMSSNISRGQFYENWRRIKSGEVKIVIATRIGVMTPFNNLELIVIDEEQDMSYKNWDMNPRYDARTVAEKLSELYKCPIVRGSATPSVESYYRADNKELKLIKIPELNFEPSSVPQGGTSSPASGRGGYCTNTILVDMKKERWAKNYSCISKKLKYEIGYALKNKLQTILLINRQGMSSFSVCESCKTVIKCPKCDRAVIYDNRGHYKCAHCAYKTSITPKCGKCGGLVFKNVGLGTQKVEREINNIFPMARVARIDSQAIRVKNYQEKIYNEFSQGQIDILVGTQMITKGWDLPNVTLVGIIDTDNMLSIPDFSAGQKAYELINQVAGRVNRPGAKWPGVVVVQSYNPENKLLKLIAQGNYAGFFEREIAERKALRLPPIGKLIKLTIQDYDKNRAEKSAQGIYELLRNTSDDISVSEPQEAYISNIRGRFRRQIILKTTGEKWPAKTIKLLKALPSLWIVDVDPISII